MRGATAPRAGSNGPVSRTSESSDPLTFGEAAAAALRADEQNFWSTEPDLVEERNLRLALGDNWIRHPETVNMRRRWWRIELDPQTGQVQRRPISPDKEEGCWQPVFPGSHAYVRDQAEERAYQA
jgi:hypothetical protein